ncbi:hypothetical protein [Chryseobacterium sp.]|uniref:DUF748 domain-containing protein n=1 Tax=Chryseobacterium sp. TaxID=1871047 RepID=UPI0011CAD2A6|nr:hypothetical protein [Chryseobacterium sp.]TXF75956.1 hypothetical protein FUA25_08620 [Chryseobacterium sp.]
MKKWQKVSAIILGVLLVLFLIANFGLNFWIQKNLPRYIKNNSHYTVSYQSLDVNLGNGNIFATGITINSKNPQNQEVIGLQGTVDTLSISRLGIYDAVFNKRISSSNLILKNPNINITLAKPKDKSTEKKQNPLAFDNISIKNGNIQIFRHTKQKLFSVKDLVLNVENLEMTEESVESKLPVVFDQYDLKGRNFYYRPDNVYAFTASFITTENGEMSIRNFAMIPLLSFQNFRKFFPKKQQLFDFKASQMNFKDMALKSKEITLSNVYFENPNLKLFTTDVKTAKKDKPFTYEVELENVVFKNAVVSILKPDGTPKFNAGNLNVNVSKLKMDEETAKGNLPFSFEDYKIDGRQILFASSSQKITAGAFAMNPHSADIRNISAKPAVAGSDKTLLDLTASQLNLKINEWKFIDKKLKLDIENVLVTNLNGKIKSGSGQAKKKPGFEGIHYPLTVKNVVVRNSNLVYESQNKPLSLNQLNLNIQNIEMNAETVKSGFPFKIGNYQLSTKNFSYRINPYYSLSSSLLKVSNKTLQMSNFAVKPLVSRSQFLRMIPTEKDLYDLKISQINMQGTWDFLSTEKSVKVSQATLNGMNANIFRSKLPKDDLTEKPLYSKLLRSIKFPFLIQNLDIKNSVLVYEEDTKQSEGPGKLTFGNFNMNVKNLNSGKMKGAPTLVPITISCRFMDASPMNVKWSFDTAQMNDAFSIAGNISDLPASRINPFIEPYLKIRATGEISDLIFNFKGNYLGLNGTVNMKHKDLRVEILKTTGEKNKLLSAVANIFVRTDSGNYPESVVVDNVQRDKTKSFFNLFWKGIEEGLKKTLIGKNIENTEKSIKNTVSDTKGALQQGKSTVKDTKTAAKDKIEKVKENVGAKKENITEKVQEKKGIFRKVFKKKEKAEN